MVPAVLQTTLYPFIPESPRYLLLYKNQKSKAEESLYSYDCIISTFCSAQYLFVDSVSFFLAYVQFCCGFVVRPMSRVTCRR